jgi:adenylosuccinate lyase
MNELNALSPLDGRYSNKVKDMAESFSEFALFKKRVYVEIEYLIKLLSVIKQVQFKKESLKRIHNNFSLKDAERIKEIEKETKHDVVAVIEFIKEKVNEDVKPFVHFGLTSEDVNNLSYGLILKDAKSIYLKYLKEAILILTELAKKYKTLPMLSRTHAEPATPTTVGKEFANYAVRLSWQYKKLKEIEISGKLSGSTGNFNALSTLYPKINWIDFSKNFVNNLGLLPDLFTTQILFQDSYTELFDTIKRINSIIIDLDRNIWLYFLLDYFSLKVDKVSVGSSTMPHKINPISFENSEGNAEIAENFFSFLSRKLIKSRLQRDLSDSTVKRNIGTAFGYSLLSVKSLIEGLKQIIVDKEKVQKDLNAHGEIFSELIQLYLRKSGSKNGYSLMKEKRENKKFSYKNYLEKLGKNEPEFILDYIEGMAPELVDKAIQLINKNLN